MENNKALKIINNVKNLIIGKDHVIEKMLISILAGGHLLIEDIPGVGKTSLAKALAQSMDLSYKRLQFTPDLMPSDIIGVSIFNRKKGDFEFRKGPIFHQLLLADEINRSSPKTQSSLLQAMGEGEVSTEDMDYKLESPFIVIATQNPIEYQGTFPLPEAQLDRFLMGISIGYPEGGDEVEILKKHTLKARVENLRPVSTREDIVQMQAEVESLTVDPSILEYIVKISHATRNCDDIQLGASPRASIDLLKAARARAFLRGRNYVIPDDVKYMALAVLNHRLILSPKAKIEGRTMEEILRNLLNTIYIPVI